jgi:hypothetical protein
MGFEFVILKVRVFKIVQTYGLRCFHTMHEDGKSARKAASQCSTCVVNWRKVSSVAFLKVQFYNKFKIFPTRLLLAKVISV